MTQDEIREIILSKRASGVDPTPEEMQIALEFFTAEELECMRSPTLIDFTKCFCTISEDPTITIELPSEEFE